MIYKSRVLLYFRSSLLAGLLLLPRVTALFLQQVGTFLPSYTHYTPKCQVSGLTQSIGESAAKMGEDLQQKVNTLTAFDLEVRGVLNMACVIKFWMPCRCSVTQIRRFNSQRERGALNCAAVTAA